MRVFLADLGHNQVTISSDVYPLGVANLATYAQAYLERPEPLDIRIFREPQDLKSALDERPPDVLGLSSYSWNYKLSLSFARYAKARDAKLLTLMGGPNFPLTAGEQEKVLREMPEIDIAVRGPTYEGERAFLNIIRRACDVACSLEGIQEAPVPGNMWIDRRSGEFVRGGEIERIQDLDEIPSPYLAGWMDPYFQTGYFPLMQISRGCPFTCTFCNSSARSNSKIHAHSLENLKADLLYIAERVRHEMPLCLADDNFGMFPLDEEVAEFIATLQERYHWPHYIRTTTGKNRGERIISVMRKIRGALPMTAAVQSMNPVVLKNIERSNIKLETYAQIQQEVVAQGMQSYGELILCLPGETKDSFMRGIRDLLGTGVKRISAHQLMLLHGAPLSNPDSRQRFGMKTRFRVVARNLGVYAAEPVVETEEMVVETSTFSFQDYLDARVFHLLLTIFHYEGNFEEAFEFARQEGISAFDLIARLQGMLNGAPADFRKLIQDFVRESQEELFDSEQECLEWARRNFDGLLSGDVGGNLLSKYSMLGRFYTTQDSLNFLETAIAAALCERGTAPESMHLLRTVIEYLRCALLHARFSETLAMSPWFVASHDLEAWRREGYRRPLTAYAHPNTLTYRAAVDAERRALIESRIATFGEHPAGLGKFTRTMFARDLRRDFALEEQTRNQNPGQYTQTPFPNAGQIAGAGLGEG